MSEWPEVTLGEICAEGGGFIRTGPFGSQLHQSDYTDDPAGIPVVMPKDMAGGRVDLTSIARIDRKTADRLSQHLLTAGDVALSRRGDVGRSAWIGAEDLPVLCGTGSMRVHPGTPASVRPDYLRYFLRSRLAIDYLEGQAVGATMPNLNAGIVTGMPVPVLPLILQQHAASVLAALDDLIENNRRRVGVLEEMARAIYREWFVHFRFPGHGDATFVDSDLGPMPEGWESSTLGEAGKWLSGGTPQTSVDEYWNGDIPWITSGTLTSLLLDRSERMLTQLGVENGTKTVPRDALLFVVRGMSLVREFRVGIADVPVAFGQDCKALLTNDEFEPLFLAFEVITRADEVQGMHELAGHGTGKLSTDRLKAIAIPKPPAATQQAFVKVVAPLRESMTAIRLGADRLEELRDLLLPKLVAGQIDVSELDLRAVADKTGV